MTINEHSSITNKKIKQIANEYNSRGYKVIVSPSYRDVPSFMTNYRPDLIAMSDNDNVVIEVKTRKNLLKEGSLKLLAEEIDRHSNWRFELIVTNPKDSLNMRDDTKLANLETLKSRVNEAERLYEERKYESSLLLLWSAIEGYLRNIAINESINIEGKSALYLLKKVYSRGYFSNTFFNSLNNSLKVRNSIAHGFQAKLDSRNYETLIESLRMQLLDMP